MKINNQMDCIQPLLDYIKEWSDDTDTSLTIHITGTTFEATVQCRTPESLMADGISMRNLKGEWIK